MTYQTEPEQQQEIKQIVAEVTAIELKVLDQKIAQAVAKLAQLREIANGVQS